MNEEVKKLITNFTALNVYGKYSSYDSYKYPPNSSSYWEKEIPLVVGESVEGSGFKIEIIEVTDNDITIRVYKSEYNEESKDYEYIFKYDYQITNMNNVYIEQYSYTSGSPMNDDISSTSSEVAVRLIESDILKITDQSEKIDKNLKKIQPLINNEKNYFEILRKLENSKFKATDETYGNRIIAFKNEKAIEEKNQIIQELDIINKIIADIELYNQYNIDFIKKAYSKGVNKQEYEKILFPYMNMIANDDSYSDELYPDELRTILSRTIATNCLSTLDYACFGYLIINIYAKSRYYFRANSVAIKLIDLIEKDNFNKIPREFAYEFYYEVAKFFYRVCNRKKAMECYQKASNCIKDKNIQKAAYAMAKYYEINSTFPENLKESTNIDKIKDEFGEYADDIISKTNYNFIKIDEVEFTSKFVDNYINVLEEVEKEIDKVGDLHLVYQRWNLIQDILKNKYKIDWRTPKEMNPKMMFD